MQSYPPPAMPAMVVPQATDQKKDESRESYRPNGGGNSGLKIFLIVGIVGAALVACIIVGVVVGVLLTTTTGEPRTPCEEIAEKTIGALPYRFTNVSESGCVYGYYLDGVCMYDVSFDARDNIDEPCYGKDHGADHVAGTCYYTGESTCHCSAAYRPDENLCYNFAVSTSLLKGQACPNGLATGDYCLYEQRKKQNRDCKDPWDIAYDGLCYTRKRKACDSFMDDGMARENCLKSKSFVKKATS